MSKKRGDSLKVIYIILVAVLITLLIFQTKLYLDLTPSAHAVKGDNISDKIEKTYTGNTVELWVPQTYESISGVGLTGSITGTGSFKAYLVSEQKAYLIVNINSDNGTSGFNDLCESTCDLPVLMEPKYILKYEVEGVDVYIDSITYSNHPLSSNYGSYQVPTKKLVVEPVEKYSKPVIDLVVEPVESEVLTGETGSDFSYYGAYVTENSPYDIWHCTSTACTELNTGSFASASVTPDNSGGVFVTENSPYNIWFCNSSACTEINTDSFDGGTITSDGSGGAFVTELSPYNMWHCTSSACTEINIDGFDGGSITSDGLGGAFVTELSPYNMWHCTSSACTEINTDGFNGDSITSDGLGGAFVTELSPYNMWHCTSSACTEINTGGFHYNSLTSDGSGGVFASEISSPYNMWHCTSSACTEINTGRFHYDSLTSDGSGGLFVSEIYSPYNMWHCTSSACTEINTGSFHYDSLTSDGSGGIFASEIYSPYNMWHCTSGSCTEINTGSFSGTSITSDNSGGAFVTEIYSPYNMWYCGSSSCTEINTGSFSGDSITLDNAGDAFVTGLYSPYNMWHCTSSACTEINSVGIFAGTSLSSFSHLMLPYAASNLKIWDSVDSGETGGDQTPYVTNNFKFFADYTDEASSKITGADCDIYFHDLATTYDMTWNAGSQLYEYTRSLSTPANYIYNITCSKSGYDTLNLTDSINVFNEPSSLDYVSGLGVAWTAPPQGGATDAAFDGSRATGIGFTSPSFDPPGVGRFITIDYGVENATNVAQVIYKTQLISNSGFYHHQPLNVPGFAPGEITITFYGSHNAVNWVQLGDPKVFANAYDLEVKHYTGSDDFYRYFKVHIFYEGNYDNFDKYGYSIAEVEMNGSSIVLSNTNYDFTYIDNGTVVTPYAYQSGTLNKLQFNDTPQAMVVKSAETNGTYVSQVFDAGEEVIWSNISWVGTTNRADGDLVPAMTSNSAPSGTVIASGTNTGTNYWYAFDDRDTSTYAWLGPLNEDYHFIQYDFGAGNEQLVTAMNLSRRFGSPNEGPKNFTAYGFKELDTIPTMTSNTAPSGVVTSSDSDTAAWEAFDNVITAGREWLGPLNQDNHWIQYDYGAGNGQRITKMFLWRRYGSSGEGPKDILINASNDGLTWTTIDSFTYNQYQEMKELDIANPGTYRHYRFIGTSHYANPTNWYIGFREIEMYTEGADLSTLVEGFYDTTDQVLLFNVTNPDYYRAYRILVTDHYGNNAGGNWYDGFQEIELFGNINQNEFKVKSCDDALCSGETWDETYYSSPQTLNVQDNQYFQYQINMSRNSPSPEVYNVTIGIQGVPNQAPTHTTPILNATSSGNLTSDNLICYNQSTSDADGDSVKNIFNWYLDGTSITLLNLPFEGGSNGSWTKDYSYGNNASQSNSDYYPTWNINSGYDGKGAYEFDGTGDYLALSEDINLSDNASWTISYWFYDDSGSRISIGYYGDNGNSIAHTVFNTIRFRTTDQNTYVDLDMFANPFNAWHHLVLVADGTDTNNIKLYYDGNLTDTDTLSDSSFEINSIGAGWSTLAYIWDGKLDDILIFNRSLSVEQVQALYNNRTDLIVSNETSENDIWKACVTPNDGHQDGIELCSNDITLRNTPEINYNFTFITNGTVETAYGYQSGIFDRLQFNETQLAIVVNETETNGTYISQVFDAGEPVEWDNISWKGLTYSNEVELLIHSDDVNGSAIFVDSSVNDFVVTPTNVIHSTNQVKMEGSSIKFTPRSFLTVDNNITFANSESFTFDFWTYRDSATGGDNNPRRRYFWRNSPGSFYWDYGPSYYFGASLATGVSVGVSGYNLPVYEWHHIGLVRETCNLSLYVDGGLVVSDPSSCGTVDFNTLLSEFGKATGATASYDYSGYVDEMRVIRGAEWTENFTAPNSAYYSGIDMKVKSCDDASCIGETWSSEYTTTPQTLSIPDNQYFQYQINMSRNSPSPQVYNVTIGTLNIPPVNLNVTLVSPADDFNTTDRNVSLTCNVTSDVNLTNMSLYTNTSGTWEQGEIIYYDNNVLDTTDLIGYWNLNNNSLDSSGNGNDGTNNGGIQNVTGVVNGAYGFDGVDDYVEVGDIDISPFDGSSSEMTLSTWIKLNNISSENRFIISKYDSSAATNYMTFNFYTSSGKFGTSIYENTLDDAIDAITNNTVFAEDIWYHIVAVINLSDQNIDLYVDGLEEASTITIVNTPPTVFANNHIPVRIGVTRNAGGWAGYFNGSIDEVAIYNRSLSEEEINKEYHRKAETMNVTDTFYLGGLDIGSYNWNCEASDKNNNSRFAEANRTFNILEIPVNLNVTLVSPKDGFNTTDRNVSLTCNVTSDVNLTNMSLYTNTSGIWNVIDYQNISGLYNETTFNLNGLAVGSYDWNCEASDENNNSKMDEANRTFNIQAIPVPPANLTCVVNNGGCIGQYENYTAVMRLSNYTNAHAEQVDQLSVDYPWTLCCYDLNNVTNLKNTTGTTILKLSDNTNAHAEQADQSNYNYPIKLGAENYTVQVDYDTTCPQDYVCAITLSDYTNAHVASCDTNPYPLKMCLRVATAVIIELNTPQNNIVTNITTNEFSCSAISPYEMHNLTLYIWNSTDDIVYQNTKGITGSENSSAWNVTLPTDNYEWDCLGDDNSTTAWADSRRSIIIDLIKPTWSNNKTSPNSNNNYVNSNEFNITWNDNIAIENVTIEHNFNGTLQEYIMNNLGNEYYYGYDVPVGNYVWKSIAYDTAGNKETSDQWNYKVNIADSTCSLILNPVSPSVYGISLNASCSCTNPESAATLYRDGINITSENNVNVTLAAATYEYICNTSATHNYITARNASNYTINKDATILNLTLNGNDSNLTIVAGNSVIIEGTLLNPSAGYIELYKKNILINSGQTNLINTTLDLPGLYNITVTYPTTENFTEESLTYFITVIPSTPNVTLIVPPDNENTSIDTINFTCHVEDVLELTNMTLFIWNNSDNSLNYNSVRQLSGMNSTEEWNVSLGFGNYTWNCYAENNYSVVGKGINRTLERSRPVCLTGQTLCTDMTCSYDCNSTDGGPNPTCNLNGTCDFGEGCTCDDCNGEQSSCIDGSVCSNATEDCVCPIGTTLCDDLTCSLNCTRTDGGPNTICNNDTVCDDNESCSCADCNGEQSVCDLGTVCSNSTESCVCPTGTSLCDDLTCSYDCNETDGGPNIVCNNDTVCDDNESCSCADCNNEQSVCDEGNVCSEILDSCICPINTTLCTDGTCSNDCDETDHGNQSCINTNGNCETGEGCACVDCWNQPSVCGEFAVCSTEENCVCDEGYNLCDDNTCKRDCPAVCGNGNIEIGETCDGTNYGTLTCLDYDTFTGGSLTCDSCIVNTSSCTGGIVGFCGDGNIDIGEQCDGTEFAGLECSDYSNFVSGDLSCTSSCLINTTQCAIASTCGDREINLNEECDGSTNGRSCSSFGFSCGTLNCDNDCTFKTSSCTNDCGGGPPPPPPGDACDGVDCNDGDACTTDSCSNGNCRNIPKDCNDGNGCTDDSCSGGSCSHTQRDCNDNDACTTDSCSNGACSHFTPDCGDGDDCTLDFCVGGSCQHTEIDGCGDCVGDDCDDDDDEMGVLFYDPTSGTNKVFSGDLLCYNSTKRTQISKNTISQFYPGEGREVVVEPKTVYCENGQVDIDFVVSRLYEDFKVHKCRDGLCEPINYSVRVFDRKTNRCFNVTRSEGGSAEIFNYGFLDDKNFRTIQVRLDDCARGDILYISGVFVGAKYQRFGPLGSIYHILRYVSLFAVLAVILVALGVGLNEIHNSRRYGNSVSSNLLKQINRTKHLIEKEIKEIDKINHPKVKEVKDKFEKRRGLKK